MLPGIISLHFVESDPELSKNLNNPDKPNPGVGDWCILIDGTQIAAVRALIGSRFKTSDAPSVSTAPTGSCGTSRRAILDGILKSRSFAHIGGAECGYPREKTWLGKKVTSCGKAPMMAMASPRRRKNGIEARAM